MRWPHFFIIQCLLILAVGVVAYAHKDKLTVFKTPPASLSQWYKPENKRQVWLHTMFSLRREMQAAQYYASNADSEQLNKWVTKFSEHYLKLGEMVPEWNKLLNHEQIKKLQTSSKSGQLDEVTRQLDLITASCDSCHEDYRVITALKYRAPDFSLLQITPALSFNDHMTTLTQQVNQIKIFAQDGQIGQALSSFSDLSEGLETLGTSCSDCHKKGTKVFPGTVIKQTMSHLQESLQHGTLKDQGRYLGTLAVQACARCHGTHRLSSDMRNKLSTEQDWLKLIKH